MKAQYVNEDNLLSQEDLVRKYGYEDLEGKLESYMDAPRWAKVPKFLRKLAFELDLQIDIDVEKSLLRERTYFTVYGKKSQLEEFKNMYELAMENYNKYK